MEYDDENYQENIPEDFEFQKDNEIIQSLDCVGGHRCPQ
jgi:hypothetical protein